MDEIRYLNVISAKFILPLSAPNCPYESFNCNRVLNEQMKNSEKVNFGLQKAKFEWKRPRRDLC